MTVDSALIFISDDQERDSIDVQSMPALRAMLDDPDGHWVQFPRSKQPTPRCAPCRACVLTGQRCDHNGVVANDFDPLDTATCINVPIKAAGADTGFFGKYGNGFSDPTLPPGWTTTWMMNGDLGDYSDYAALEKINGGSTVQRTEANYPGEYLQDIIGEKAVDFLTAKAGSPFFAVVTPTAPHSPMTPAPRHAAVPITLSDPVDFNQIPTNAPTYLANRPSMSAGTQTTVRTDRKNARRCLLAIDEMIVAAMAAVDLSRTLVIFCTDNAVAFGRKRVWDETVMSQKAVPYHYSNTAMLAIRHPDVTARTDQRLVDLLDIPPMLLNLFGATGVVTPEGRDLMPVILDTPGTVWRNIQFSMNIADDLGIIPKWYAAETSRWRYADYFEIDEIELYDLAADPQETVNVAATYPDVCDELQARIDEWVADSQAPVTWPPVPAVLSYNVGASSFVGNLA